VIPTIITQIANGRRVIKIGEVTPIRDFSHVKDTVAGFIAALNSDKGLGQVTNLGSNFEISIKETAHLIAQCMGVSIDMHTEAIRKRPKSSEVTRLWADNSKAKSLFGWRPEYTGFDGLKRGLTETIEWFTKGENILRYKSDSYNI